MGQIDVSDVLGDPDFMDAIVLIHRAPCVDQYGKNHLKETGIQTFGCVQPASGKTLSRLPEALRVANLMSFWVKGKIVADGKSQYPDIIVSKGVRFEVQTVMDWTNWGDGWCEGTAVQGKPTL